VSTTEQRVLVTGGAGFIGSHLCKRLLQDGFLLTRVLRWCGFPLCVEVDEIYNLACAASPIHYQFDPVQTTKTGVHGATNMLRLGKRIKAKILQASTSDAAYPNAP
jgi:UDP-glucuronate decarboxylase